MDYDDTKEIIDLLTRIAVALETLASAPKLAETIYSEESWG